MWLLALTITPILWLTLEATLAAMVHGPFAVPPADSFFYRIGQGVSYLVPFALLSLTLIGYAARERSSVSVDPKTVP
jgi:hypothetical protein